MQYIISLNIITLLTSSSLIKVYTKSSKYFQSGWSNQVQEKQKVILITKKSAIRPPRRFAEARPFLFLRAPARELLGNRLSVADSASHGTSRRCSMRSTGYRASVPQEAGLAPRPVSPRLRPGLGGRRHAVRLLSCALRAQDL
ncbi:hypothetical protein SS50377_23906 [Spironucleus salmonicida]|uniref:Uncharacterized protein n=1 Tax=Spironucleus salmonicida TaxID=348837 RepID=A0A9P8LTG6_9EUKA|nr:hypothetical protein SS50377_23906 [Spironucleus salmonicida]